MSITAAVAAGLAAVVSAVFLHDGTLHATDLAERTGYLVDHQGAWTAGWLVRMATVVLVLSMLVAITRTLTPGYPLLRSVSVQLVSIGAAAELLAGAVSIVALPVLAQRVAAGDGGAAGLFEAAEAGTIAASGFLGVGLVSVGGALVGHAASRTPPFPRWLATASILVWGAGLASAGAVLAGSATGLTLHTALFLPMLALWSAGVASTHFRPPARTGRP